MYGICILTHLEAVHEHWYLRGERERERETETKDRQRYEGVCKLFVRASEVGSVLPLHPDYLLEPYKPLPHTFLLFL
jgi:hypothetical protein